MFTDYLLQAGFSERYLKERLDETNLRFLEYWKQKISRERPFTFLVCNDFYTLNVFASAICVEFLKIKKSVRLASVEEICEEGVIPAYFCYVVYNTPVLGNYYKSKFQNFLYERLEESLPVVLYFTDQRNIEDVFDDAFVKSINSSTIQVNLEPMQQGRLGIGGTK